MEPTNTGRNIVIGVIIALIVILGIVLIVRNRQGVTSNPTATSTDSGGLMEDGTVPTTGATSPSDPNHTSSNGSNVNSNLPTEYQKD